MACCHSCRRACCQWHVGTWAWHHKQEAPHTQVSEEIQRGLPARWHRGSACQASGAWAPPVRSTTQPGQEFSPSCPLPSRDSPSNLPDTAVLRAPTAHSSPPSTSPQQPASTDHPGCHRAALSVCQTCEMLQPCVPCHCKRDLLCHEPKLLGVRLICGSFFSERGFTHRQGCSGGSKQKEWSELCPNYGVRAQKALPGRILRCLGWGPVGGQHW